MAGYAACALMACIIAAYAGLLPRARWQADDYLTISFMREFGWPFFRNWYLTWSPRLWSNMLYAAYGTIVNATHRPLTGACMALLWTGLAVACVAPAIGRGNRRSIRLLCGLAMFVLFLAGNRVSEMYFWTGGGLSYVPTLAAAVWLCWCLAGGLPDGGGRRIGAAAALLLAAGSSEMGAFLTLAVCLTLGAVSARHGWRASAWLLPGLILALTDLALVVHGRVGVVEHGSLINTYMHHAGASLLVAVPAFANELLGPTSVITGPATLLEFMVARLLILLGARWCLGLPDKTRGALLLPFAAGLVLAAYASIASAYYQSGWLCCERHETMRAGLYVLAMMSVGMWSVRWLPPRRDAAAFGITAWVAAALLLFVPEIPSISADYRALPAAIAAQAATWRSGLRTDTDTMQFVLEPAGNLISSAGFVPGDYALGPNLPWYDYAVLHYFGKRRMQIR